MAILVDPTYLTVDDFKGMYGVDTSLTDDQIYTLLVNASAYADSIMRKTLFATEIVEYFKGSGGSDLAIQRSPLAYVSQINFAQPGLNGFSITRQSVLVDYPTGLLRLYQPIVLVNAGIMSAWPRGTMIAVRYAYGYGWGPQPPVWTATDTPGYGYYYLSSLSPGQYDVAVTAATPWGETTATPQTVSTVSGSITITVNGTLGTERYRVYARPTGSDQPLVLCAEIPSTTFSQQQLTAVIQTTSPLDNNFQQTLPEFDTSIHEYPSFVKEAVYWLAQDKMAEADNAANFGLLADVDLKFGQSGQFSKGVSPNYQHALDLLTPKKLSSIFIA